MCKLYRYSVVDNIVESTVRGATFEDVFAQCPHTAPPDVLVVDVEGRDADIIRQFPFDRLKPRVVRFEHWHLNMAQRRDILSFLESKGYSTGFHWRSMTGQDTLAYY